MYRALLICNSTYPEDPGGLPGLNGPRRDGLILWRALCDPGVGMFREEDVDVLCEGTSQDILSSAAALLDNAASDDDVLLYFSGHAKRPSKDDLILCGRNTYSHSLSTLLSSGVPATSLSKMINRSDAANVIIILDCCFSGSFKGADREDFDELKGTGRYVLAASHPAQLAEDSDKGYPSPFTLAIVRGLMSVTAIDAPSKRMDLDALYTFVDNLLPQGGSRPWRGYDGSGAVVISRVHDGPGKSVVKSDRPGIEMTKTQAEPSGDLPDESLLQRSREVWRSGRRVPGDFSIADLRIWMVMSSLGLAATACLWNSYLRWPKTYNLNEQLEQDPHRYIVWPCIAACILIVLCSIVEGLLFTRLSRGAKSRREVLQATDSTGISACRRIRQVTSYVAATAVIISPFGFQNYGVTWIIALCILGVFALTSAIESLRYGDALYLAGALLVVVAAFLPVNVFDGGGYHVGISNFGGIIGVILGVLMIMSWWFKAPRGLLILTTAICLLPLMSDFAESQNIVGPYVGLAGIAVSVTAWILGAGQGLNRMEDMRTQELTRT